MRETIVVTGGGGALGQVVVKALLARGDRVAVVDRTRLKDTVSAMARELGDDCAAFALDSASVEAWRVALPAIETQLGPVTGAALIAGGWKGGAALYEAHDDGAYDAMMSSNADTVHAALRALLPGMVTRGHGSIVVIGSRAVERPWTSAGAAAYAASKAAAVTLAQAAAAEVVARGVRINAVLPSTIDTPANRTSMPDVDPMRWVSAASLAGVIAFLLSDAARDITGAAIPVYARV